MKKFWSGEETRRNGDELFRVKVVGSNPAGPTKSLFRVNKRFYGIMFEELFECNDRYEDKDLSSFARRGRFIKYYDIINIDLRYIL